MAELVVDPDQNNLLKCIDYLWLVVLGMGDWMGYGLAAGYFVAEEYDMEFITAISVAMQKYSFTT